MRRPRWWTDAFDKRGRAITPGFDIENTPYGPRVTLWSGKPDQTSPTYLTIEELAQHIVNARNAGVVLAEYVHRTQK